ncbi:MULTISPECIES: replication initiation protein [unclassified Paenibacillus]|uniref:replication initiation protein n=1 Tax=unclassified Paenibacillus TaxID=185978 RepID=UPI0030FCFBAD
MLEQLTFDYEASPVSNNYIVTKSNALIETPHNLELQEARLIYTLISLIQPDDEVFKTHFIRVKEVAELLEIKEKNYYKKIREVVARLQSKQLTIRENNGESDLVVNWLSASRYHHKKGFVELEFSPQLKPYLLSLKRSFTMYRLENVLLLKSKYSIRLYEILKRWQNFGRCKFTIEELRGLLDIDKNTLTHYGHLKQRVLIRAQSELAEKTDITFNFEEIKQGNRVVSIVCQIKNNGRKKIITDGSTSPLLDEGPFELLMRIGVRREIATELINTYGEDRVKANIQYVYEKKKDVDVENISGYIIKAIRDNYVSSSSDYNEEDDLDIETSIKQLNERIFKRIMFCNVQTKDDPSGEKQYTREMSQHILNEINKVLQARFDKNLRPLEESDFEHKYTKEIYSFMQERPISFN